jgi:hypothetical protein
MDAPQLISITNGAGIVFLGVCCAAVCVMVWFFVSLTREQRSRPVQWRMQVQVKSSQWKPIRAKEREQEFDTPFPAARLKMGIELERRETANRGTFPINVAATSPRKWWGLGAGS